MDYLYHDDPVEEALAKRRKTPPIIGAVLILFAGGLFLNTTLAANININTGGKIEFGQGMTLTAACSGSSSLTLTPISSFVNSSGVGSYYFNSVTLSGVPTSCYGADFRISVYDSSTSTALPIYGSAKSVATIWNNSGSFQRGQGSSGTAVAGSNGSFTVTFTSPLALSAVVSRITLESTAHVQGDCVNDAMCSLGDIGPGGGTVFYVSANGFSVPGAPCGSSCHYLEWAQRGSGDTRMISWSSSSGLLQSNRTTSQVFTGNQAIGSGFANTLAMRDSTQAASYAQGFAGDDNSAGQWFLPSLGELRAIYNSSVRSTGGFTGDKYWSSSEASDVWSFYLDFSDGSMNIDNREAGFHVRPIRAF